jgi:hypothetical protein
MIVIATGLPTTVYHLCWLKGIISDFYIRIQQCNLTPLLFLYTLCSFGFCVPNEGLSSMSRMHISKYTHYLSNIKDSAKVSCASLSQAIEHKFQHL